MAGIGVHLQPRAVGKADRYRTEHRLFQPRDIAEPAADFLARLRATPSGRRASAGPTAALDTPAR